MRDGPCEQAEMSSRWSPDIKLAAVHRQNRAMCGLHVLLAQQGFSSRMSRHIQQMTWFAAT